MIEALLRLIWGGIGQPFNQPPFLSGIYLWGPVLITKYRLAVFLHHGGAAGRAVGVPAVHARSAASCAPARAIRRWSGLLGISLPRVLTAVFGLGCCICRHRRRAGRAAVDRDPVDVATNAIMPAFVVVAIGGLGSFAGAVIAGLLVGVVTALTIQF